MISTLQHFGSGWLRFLWRALIFALLWRILTGGEASSWWFGVPLSLAAAWVSLRLAGDRRTPLRFMELVGFGRFFLWESVRAGVDVAWRAFQPQPALAPGCLEYRMRLPTESQRVFLANTLSLVPGTVGVHLEGDRLLIHVLDQRMPMLRSVARAEAQVAKLFGPGPVNIHPGRRGTGAFGG